ncbi:beta-2-glycoprotein 1-like [Diadema setosum]|uniref:beta-2-glycoprotein 1-like n=1 Tax=Diadema setosum TaxID=31175 RepID=UPI003B3A7408
MNGELDANTCVRPSLNPNVVISPDQASYPQWMRADVSCSDGSPVSGPTYGLCYGSDTWNPDITTSTCTSGAGGVVTTPDQTSYDPGNAVQFSCPQGGVTGSSTAACDSDGSWNYEGTELPSCQAACTAPDNTNGTATLYGSGDVIVFQCLPGYSLEGSGDTITTTCDAGEWNLEVVCVFAGCPEPEVPEGVNYVGTPADDRYFKLNQRVDLLCDDDKTPIGPEFSYCNSTNQWDPDPMLLSCHDKCHTPGFNDTHVIHTSKLTGETGGVAYDHTDTILFSCEGGLFVDGPWRTVCNDGTWSGAIGGDLPVCRANCTGPANTDVADELFHHGKKHTFQCAPTPGMVRLGGPTAFCNDGAWKPRIRCALKTEL